MTEGQTTEVEEETAPIEVVAAIRAKGISSPTIGKIAKALAKAQSEMSNPKKGSENPFFESSYADLAACLKSGLLPVNDNGLSVSQVLTGEVLHTILMHESGEWIKGWFNVIADKKTAQSFGSGLTYARRQNFSAIVMIAQTDDDGNSTQGVTVPEKPVQLPPSPHKNNAACVKWVNDNVDIFNAATEKDHLAEHYKTIAETIAAMTASKDSSDREGLKLIQKAYKTKLEELNAISIPNLDDKG